MYEARTRFQCMEELHKFLRLDEPSIYRKKIKGYCMPFGIRDKTGRIPETPSTHHYKVRKQKIKLPFAYSAKRNVKELREKKEKEKQEKEQEERQKQKKRVK